MIHDLYLTLISWIEGVDGVTLFTNETLLKLAGSSLLGVACAAGA